MSHESQNSSNPNPDQQIKEITSLIKSPIESGQQSVQFLRSFKEVVIVIGLAVMAIFTSIPELVLHNTIGVRYLTNRLWFFGLVGLVVVAGVAPIPYGGQGVSLYVLAGVCIGAMALFFYRQKIAWRRYHAGETIHSKSTSEPFGFWYRIPWLNGQWAVMKYGEPVALVLLGLLIRFGFDSALGTYLMLAALAMHSKIKLIEERELGRVLDGIDQQIESEAIQEAMEDHIRPQAQSRGWVVPIPVSDAVIGAGDDAAHRSSGVAENGQSVNV